MLASFAAPLLAAAPSQTPEPRMIAPGVSYRMDYRPGPLCLHIIELDPKEKYIAIACAAAGPVPARLRVSELAQAQSSATRYAVAAVNGDYFVMGGRTDGGLLGLNVSGGQLLSAGGGRSALVLLDNGRVQVATLRLDAWIETSSGKRAGITAVNQPRRRNGLVLYTPAFGESTKTWAGGREVMLRGVREPLQMGKVYETTVTASTQAVGDLQLFPDHVALSAEGETAQALAGLKVGDPVKLCVDLTPHLDGRIVETIGGGPRLVRDGQISVEWTQENFAPTHSLRRHPRTAAGVRSDGRVLLVAVDGRQSKSVGMTLGELAQLMLELGCRDAVNLDGGGSTTMWVRGEVVNSPCGGSERPVGDALLVMSTAPHGPPTRWRLIPESIAALPGYCVKILVEAQDEYYNPVNSRIAGLGWAFEGPIGTISPNGEFTAGQVSETATGAVKVYCAGAMARIPVIVYARPPQLKVTPETVAAAPGHTIRFSVTAADEQGRPLSFDPGQVQWAAEATAGVIDDSGVLAVGPGPSGKVSATLSGVTATARVVCASTTIMVEGFESEGTLTASSWPRQVAAACQRVTEPVREGKGAARLTYDFTATQESRAAHMELNRDIGDAVALRAWVYGDGRGHWLRAKITDGQGQDFNLDFAPVSATPNAAAGPRVDWTGWREVMAGIPAEAEPPIRWDTIYVSEFRPELQDSGALVFDALRAEVAAAAAR
jgi:hypothetical protein